MTDQLLVNVGFFLSCGTFIISQIGFLSVLNNLISLDTFLLSNNIGLWGVIIGFLMMTVGMIIKGDGRYYE
jgi:hypothetical protein